MKRSPSRYTTTPKGTEFHKKNRHLLVHSVQVVYSNSKSWYKKLLMLV